MTEAKKIEQNQTVSDRESAPSTARDPPPSAPPRTSIWRRLPSGLLTRAIAVFVTLATVAIAALLGRSMWRAYVDTPWTRDGTVRAYVVTMAPEVFGRIVELRVSDNQFVHKGDLLMVIDPTNYKIALQLADAAVDQAQATAQNAQREAERRLKLDDLSVSVEQKQIFNSNAVAAQAQYQQA